MECNFEISYVEIHYSSGCNVRVNVKVDRLCAPGSSERQFLGTGTHSIGL